MSLCSLRSCLPRGISMRSHSVLRVAELSRCSGSTSRSPTLVPWRSRTRCTRPVVVEGAEDQGSRARNLRRVVKV